MNLLLKLGYKNMGYIPHMEFQVFGKWTNPATVKKSPVQFRDKIIGMEIWKSRNYQKTSTKASPLC